jgi:hypothetical protein
VSQPIHAPAGSRYDNIIARWIPEKKHALRARPSSVFERARYLLASDLRLGSIDGCRSRKRSPDAGGARAPKVIIRNRYCDSVSIG